MIHIATKDAYKCGLGTPKRCLFLIPEHDGYVCEHGTDTGAFLVKVRSSLTHQWMPKGIYPTCQEEDR
tara:strand:+ start:8909 stop:9112 length:204 start_codon:yes stop_codon:yes gene_type:complete